MANNLTDTSRIVLAAAAAREDLHALPLPPLRAPAIIVRKTLAKLIDTGLLEEVPANADDERYRHNEGSQSTTLVVTGEGLRAIGIDTPTMGRTRATPAPKATRVAKAKLRPTSAQRVRKRGQSKQAVVLALLRRQHGATIDEMMGATDWQAHSVRGFMSGALRKRLGIDVISEKGEDGARHYFVAPLRS